MRPQSAEYAGKTIRLLSHLIDVFVLYIAQLAGGYFGGFVAAGIGHLRGIQSPEGIRDYAMGGMLFGMIFWGIAAWILNYGVLQGLTGKSIGKKICGLKVCHVDGSPCTVAQSVVRSICYVVSIMPFYLGYCMIFWTEKSQCLHDWLCHTVVIDVPKKTAHIHNPIPSIAKDSLDKAA